MGTVLWFAPHQDDETLTMGVGIRHHLEAGHDCHVILCTDGSASGVRTQLGLSVDEFVAARVDEMIRAARKLGVPLANIRASTLMAQDGKLTAGVAGAIVDEALAMFPGALLKGTTDLAPASRHPDHVAIGQALRARAGSHDVRMYVEGYLLSAVKAAAPAVKITTERCTSTGAVLRACAEYDLRDTVARMYGIGYRSVADEFDALTADPVSYYHSVG